MISPGTFIPAAERFGLMSSLDRWVVRQVLCEQATAIQAIEGLSVGINLSGNSLDDPLFLPYLLDLIACSPLAPERLHFELTETAVVSKLSIASRLINRLRELGCKVALDDFGSGLSSFNYLKNFAVDIIKIDGSFVRHLDTNPLDQTIVASIHHIARHLGAQTVAEFVESQAAFEQLQAIGVDYAQGYAIGRPEPFTETLQRLHSTKAAASSALPSRTIKRSSSHTWSGTGSIQAGPSFFTHGRTL
nr:EAL domain-containing protein [Pseudomonas duriflava]